MVFTGLKNKTTLMGKVKRFERRKPRLARIVRFHVIFIVFGLISLSLIPGSDFPFQKQFKINIFHSKSIFNYYWNYEIGKQKQKYLYLLLEDLLSQMNYHQIYQIEQIQRVFGEIDRITAQEKITFQMQLQSQIQRIQNFKDQDKYIQTNYNTTSLKNSSGSQIDKVSQKKQKNTTSQSLEKLQQKSNTIIDKRSQLKQKLRKKYQSQKKEKQVILNSEGSQKPQKKLNLNPQNENEQPQKTNIKTKQKSSQSQTKNKNKQICYDQKPLPHLNIKRITQDKLIFSPSFNNNMLMYYILVLQNIIRYQTKLLNKKTFYQLYYKSAQKFIFNQDLDELLSSGQHKSLQICNQFKQSLNRQVNFMKLLRNSLMVTASQNNTKNQYSVIDPHKILTYLINYRHLLLLGQKQNQAFGGKVKQIKNKQVQAQYNDQKDAKIKRLLLNYINLIERKQNKISDSELEKQKSKIQARNTNNQDLNLNQQNRLIQLGISNKGFIKSLKELYISQKNTEPFLNQNLQQKQHNKPSNQTNESQSSCQPDQHKPLSFIVKRVFAIMDQWYNSKQDVQNYQDPNNNGKEKK